MKIFIQILVAVGILTVGGVHHASASESGATGDESIPDELTGGCKPHSKNPKCWEPPSEGQGPNVGGKMHQ